MSSLSLVLPVLVSSNTARKVATRAERSVIPSYRLSTRTVPSAYSRRSTYTTLEITETTAWILSVSGAVLPGFGFAPICKYACRSTSASWLCR